MFFLLYRKYLLLPLQARLLAGFSALVIILGLSGVLFVNSFVLDKISFYNNNATVFYLKITNNKTGDFYKDKIIGQLLDNFSLSGLDRHFLDQDLAVTCSSPQRQLRCQLLIRSKQAEAIEDYLSTEKIAFKKLGDNIIAIGKSDMPIKKNYNPLIYFKFQEGLIKHDLFIVVCPPQNLNSELEKALAFLRGSLRMSGNTENNGIIINGEINAQINIELPANFDILIVNRTGEIGSNTLDQAIEDKNIGKLTTLFAGQDLILAMAKKSEADNIIGAYDFFISSKQQISQEKEKDLEKILLDLAKNYQTFPKNIYLNDGTKVKLLKPADNLSFAEPINNLNMLTLKNGAILYYGYKDKRLIIGNNLDFQPQLDSVAGQKAIITLSSLPKENFIRKYLGSFSYLAINDDQIIIK